MEITKEDLQILCKRYDELLKQKTEEISNFVRSMQNALRNGHHSTFIEMTGRLVGKNVELDELMYERVKYHNALHNFMDIEIKEDKAIPKSVALFVLNNKVVGSITGFGDSKDDAEN